MHELVHTAVVQVFLGTPDFCHVVWGLFFFNATFTEWIWHAQERNITFVHLISLLLVQLPLLY